MVLVRNLIVRMIRGLALVLPKRSQLVLATFPDFDDTGRAVLAATEGRGIDVVYLANGRNELPQDLSTRTDVRVVRESSLRGVWLYARSSHVLFTHVLYGAYLQSVDKRPPNQTLVNLWHGMPLKKIGMEYDGRLPLATKGVATSPIFQTIIARAWGMAADDVLVTGQPRTDRLLTTSSERVAAIRKLIGVHDKLLVWLPTWRKGRKGRIDGAPDQSALEFPDLDLTSMSRVLTGGSVLVVKPHPLSVGEFESSFDLPNLLRIDDDWLYRNELTLYEILGASDGLITDASSVWVDYLLVDKPIVFAMADIDEYSSSRGFYFDPLTDILPGPLVKTGRDLVSAVEDLLRSEDVFAEKRRQVREDFHTYVDCGSSERLLKAVGVLPFDEEA